ncbi:MAG: hypothetical protein CVV47_01885 [Spirochaetae bacterium HGW-Spirochaetae-3]|jgi:DNA/RNA-binding domain of Phe-tRNA-synthetase-like protein|nr:MAG: hypothetical protein CVV47_01885 [Spirochaetae bacterium HGW-Spirochaetae-3]
MKRFIIEDGFWDIFPDARIGIVVCNNIDNSIKDASIYEALLRKSELEARKYIALEPFSDNDVVKSWRGAYQRFKTKKGARSSIEALLNRVKKENPLPTINPLVDIYNAISLTYGLPCGGEDIDTFVGDVRLTQARGDEDFVTLGTDENAPPYEGEIVYKDDAGAICRCWNWRESVRTMLTEKTTNAFMCLESIDGSNLPTLESALAELARLIRGRLSGTCSTHVLDRAHASLVIQ